MSLGGNLRRAIFFARDRMENQGIGANLNEIRNGLSEPGLALEIQSKRIRELLVYAASNSPFYKNLAVMEFQDFPVVNKQVLIENYQDVCVPPELVPYQRGPMHIAKTSGSTGMVFKVPQDTRKRARRIAELKYFGELAGYQSHESLVQLQAFNVHNRVDRFKSFKDNVYKFDASSMGDERLSKLLEIIERKSTVAIIGYASWLSQLVNFATNNPVLLEKIKTLKTLIAISEHLHDETKDKVKQYLNADIVSRYSNEEQGVLAQQLAGDDSFKLNHASYYFEILKVDCDLPAESGELGRIVVTDLFNYAFPMIRYDTGDTGVISRLGDSEQELSCLSAIYGRKQDVVYSAGGDPIHPVTLSRALKIYPEIRQWQFIQKTSSRYIVKLNLYRPIDDKVIVDCITNIFGNEAKVEVEVVSDIPVLASGKRRSVICELEHEG
nr:phenylacetate--CoA ligase family protein [Halomonas socia]